MADSKITKAAKAVRELMPSETMTVIVMRNSGMTEAEIKEHSTAVRKAAAELFAKG